MAMLKLLLATCLLTAQYAVHGTTTPVVTDNVYIPGLGHRGLDVDEEFVLLAAKVAGPTASFELVDKNPIRGTATLAVLGQVTGSGPKTGDGELSQQIVECVFDPLATDAFCKDSEFITDTEGNVISGTVTNFTEQRVSIPLTLPTAAATPN
ncbi:hypothetical protein Clacol_008405 [Clathrus columnatus]|uniref:Uncharacterized protein n=1 Tax=Clathrus columnatus TaxID=1419009 RepID=A0AAV5AIE5_9AGAM|nr:hypothetical protein Clacol_008405 [Clathrus columnatus]